MKKAAGLSVALVLVVMGMVGAAWASTFSVDVDANGSVYFGLVGVNINQGIIKSTAPDTVFGEERIDTLNFAGGFVAGMEFANPYTIDRIWVVHNGYAAFDQSYEGMGSFGTVVHSDGIGVLWSIGSSTGAMTEVTNSNYGIYQYAQRFDPPWRVGASLEFSGPEGEGFSVMNAQLSDEWWYRPAYAITDWDESFDIDPEDYTGVRVIDFESNFGFSVDMRTLWKHPLDMLDMLDMAVLMYYNIDVYFPENQE